MQSKADGLALIRGMGGVGAPRAERGWGKSLWGRFKKMKKGGPCAT